MRLPAAAISAVFGMSCARCAVTDQVVNCFGRQCTVMLVAKWSVVTSARYRVAQITTLQDYRGAKEIAPIPLSHPGAG